MSARGWMFTIFDMDWKVPNHELIMYIVYQKESTPSTGRLHFQGYILLKSPRTLKFVREILKSDPHLEKRLGSHEQAKAYCTKEESRVEGPWEQGTEPKPGKRTDILGAKKILDEGGSISEVAESNFELWCRNYKAFEKYILLKVKVRSEAPHVIWIHGPSGTGKSKRAYEFATQKESFYYKPPANKWWDGYTGQEVVVIDDYKGAWELEYLLTLLDRYPLKVEVKGGSVEFNSKYIVITSNKRPARYCTDEPKQLLRRISENIDLRPDTEQHGGIEGNTDLDI